MSIRRKRQTSCIRRNGAVGVRGTKAELREQSAEAVASYSGAITRCLPKRRVRLDLVEKRRSLSDVGRLPWRQRQRDRVAECIDDGVDLCRQAAAGTADGLILAAFFWAPRWCARTMVASIIMNSLSASAANVSKMRATPRSCTTVDIVCASASIGRNALAGHATGCPCDTDRSPHRRTDGCRQPYRRHGPSGRARNP